MMIRLAKFSEDNLSAHLHEKWKTHPIVAATCVEREDECEFYALGPHDTARDVVEWFLEDWFEDDLDVTSVVVWPVNELARDLQIPWSKDDEDQVFLMFDVRASVKWHIEVSS